MPASLKGGHTDFLAIPINHPISVEREVKTQLSPARAHRAVLAQRSRDAGKLSSRDPAAKAYARYPSGLLATGCSGGSAGASTGDSGGKDGANGGKGSSGGNGPSGGRGCCGGRPPGACSESAASFCDPADTFAPDSIGAKA